MKGHMIDLHCHLLPGLDDGAADLAASIDMATAFAADGVAVVACTPHILPGLYHNTGPQIRVATTTLQQQLQEQGISLRLVTGADNHITPDFVSRLKDGELLTLADSRYVLVEPPHHVPPPRLEDFFFNLLVADYVPILTHPERLTWIDSHYPVILKLAQAGVWMQITAGSLSGIFGRNARYWAERMLDEGCAHLLATDAHDMSRRPPNLGEGRELAAKRVGDVEAYHLVVTRPRGVLSNELPSNLPQPAGGNQRARSSIAARRAFHGLLTVAVILLTAAFLASCVASSNPSTSGVGSEQQLAFAGAGPSTGTVQQAAFRGGGSSYHIGPFDVLDISVFEVPELTKSVQVTDAGTINLPLVGEMRVAGRTPQDVERELTHRLGTDYLQNPQVTVFVKEYNSQTVAISGAIKKPGVYPIRGKTTLLQMVALAGDFDAAADSNVLILRESGGKRMAGKFDVADIQKGKAEDPILQAGDQIVAGSSFMRKGFNAILKAIPIVGTFALL